MPGGHGLHRAAPAALYRPTGHSDAAALVEPSGQAYPAVQGPEQVRDVSPAAPPYCPAGQAPLHAADAAPEVFPNRPTLQLVHTLALPTLYCPAGHAAAVALAEPEGQKYPGARCRQRTLVPRRHCSAPRCRPCKQVPVLRQH